MKDEIPKSQNRKLEVLQWRMCQPLPFKLVVLVVPELIVLVVEELAVRSSSPRAAGQKVSSSINSRANS